MTATGLKEAAQILKGATCPEDVFGTLTGDLAEALRDEYREWAKMTHSDLYHGADKKLAEEAFKDLQKWHDLAGVRIKQGRYGDRSSMDPVVITTRTAVYTITERIASGDICEVYGGHDANNADLCFKVVRNPRNNDLALAERNTLHHFWHDAPSRELKIMAHIPRLVDSFELGRTGIHKRVNVFKRLRGFYTLEQVHKRHPILDTRDAAWMFNRILGALLASHQNRYTHGAVIPAHFLVSLETHNGVLVDWSYAAKFGDPIKAISPAWKAFYPPELFASGPDDAVFVKRPGVTAATDVFMAAMCLLYLLGGDPAKQVVPPLVPTKIKGMIKACLLGPKHRPNDVHALHIEFMELLASLYGPPAFRKLSMA